MAEVVVQRLLRAAACFHLWMEEAKSGGDSKAGDAWDEEDAALQLPTRATACPSHPKNVLIADLLAMRLVCSELLTPQQLAGPRDWPVRTSRRRSQSSAFVRVARAQEPPTCAPHLMFCGITIDALQHAKGTFVVVKVLIIASHERLAPSRPHRAFHIDQLPSLREREELAVEREGIGRVVCRVDGQPSMVLVGPMIANIRMRSIY